jgi:hypothetical protein
LENTAIKDRCLKRSLFSSRQIRNQIFQSEGLCLDAQSPTSADTGLIGKWFSVFHKPGFSAISIVRQDIYNKFTDPEPDSDGLRVGSE